jgi:hypothetical protein
MNVIAPACGCVLGATGVAGAPLDASQVFNEQSPAACCVQVDTAGPLAGCTGKLKLACNV